MKTMRLVLPLLSVGLFGCDVDGPVNSKDFGPQPWPGPCSVDTYSNGEHLYLDVYNWENGLLMRIDLPTSGSCLKYFYKDDGRLLEERRESPCNGPKTKVSSYLWEENGQLREKTTTNYNEDTGEPYSFSKGVYTYGPEDELIHYEGGDWDPETETISVSYIIDYFYDDLGRMIRKEETRPQTSPEPNYITFMEYHDDEPGFFRVSRDNDGDGDIDQVEILEYDENGLFVHSHEEGNPEDYGHRTYDESGNILAHEFINYNDSFIEYIYTYDCWE
jgi:hypothetical protein